MKPITHKYLNDFRHGFFTRQGGISKGIYAALNIGLNSDDDAKAVKENRFRISTFLKCKRLITPTQSHSNHAAVIASASGNKPEADALITNCPDIAIGVVTADCVPILIGNKPAGVIAAIHAGWRGAQSGIIQNALRAMSMLGAKAQDSQAVIGPAISQSNYEVDAAFKAHFDESHPHSAHLFAPGETQEHFQFNLPAFVHQELENADIATALIPICTYENEDLLFSYRRATHNQEKDYGRQGSFICL